MTSTDIQNLIVQTASALGVDPRMALEVAIQESGAWWQNNQPIPNSSAGAIGIFQLMPATAAQLGVDPTDDAQNIQGGVQYLSQMLSLFSGNVAEALGAFDWGLGNMQNAIAQHGAGWMNYAPFETQDYVQTILGNVGSQYTVSAGAPSIATATDSTATEEANVIPAGLSLGTWLWIGGLAFVGLFVWELLE